jgi:flagellar biosynthetic protein FlhB
LADNENRSQEDLTEEPSQHRLEEYRNKGQVAQSREIAGLAALLAAGAVTYGMAPRLGTEMFEFMREVFRTDLSSKLDLGTAHLGRTYLFKALHIMISVGMPICSAGFVVGALASFMQIGAIFTFDPIMPDFEKINPLSGLQRMISLKQLVEAARLIVKMAIVLWIAYSLIKTDILLSPAQTGGEAGTLLMTYGKSAKTIFLTLIGVLSVFAAIDYGFQRFEYNKNLRMTKQEAKQEHKEREGDPQIRARIRAVQREMARRRMMQAVKKADVIITNPTHIAIALKYDTNSMAAPKVVAKGADFMAQRIKQVALEAGIPLVENVPLARTLFKTVKIGQNIPRALYQAVAEVLAYVYKLKKRNL